MRTKLYFIIISFVFSGLLSAQEKHECYLFDNFTKGKVFYKEGATTENIFNYDILREKLVFITKDSVIMDLANPSIVAYANIGKRTFEHIKDGLL